MCVSKPLNSELIKLFRFGFSGLRHVFIVSNSLQAQGPKYVATKVPGFFAWLLSCLVV